MVDAVHVYPRDTSGNVVAYELSPSRVDVVRRHLGVGSWAVTLRSPDDADVLALPGAGAVFTLNGSVVASGQVSKIRQEFDGGQWSWTVAGVDDGVLLDVTGWPVPGNAIGSQTSTHWTDTDAAETVMKGFVTANVVTRLSGGLTVAADAAQGSSITGRSRFASVLERLREWGLSGGVGWTVLDSGSGPVFDVYEPTDRTGTVLFSAQPGGGALERMVYERVMPDVTRVVVGGDGDDTARKFRTRTDSTAESTWKVIRERLVDQRQTNVDAELDQAGDEHLAENGDRTTVALTLRDVPGQRYGTHYQVGDEVPVMVADGVTFTDVVWEVRIAWDQGDGLQVFPTVGKPDDQPTTARLRLLGQGLRHLQEAQ